jgi:hypothetical protein
LVALLNAHFVLLLPARYWHCWFQIDTAAVSSLIGFVRTHHPSWLPQPFCLKGFPLNFVIVSGSHSAGSTTGHVTSSILLCPDCCRSKW